MIQWKNGFGQGRPTPRFICSVATLVFASEFIPMAREVYAVQCGKTRDDIIASPKVNRNASPNKSGQQSKSTGVDMMQRQESKKGMCLG